MGFRGSVTYDFRADSNAFADEHLRGKCQRFTSRDDLLEHCLDVARPGDALEFGVYIGTSLRMMIEHRTRRRCYGFDSFLGLPEAWEDIDFHVKPGHFGMGGTPPEVKGARFVVGWFNESLPPWVADRKPDDVVGFVHVDCDLYSSTMTVLRELGPHLVGAVVMFDEFFMVPRWRQDEWKALVDSGLRYEWLGYVEDPAVELGMQVAIRVIG
jgi:hypothetical protein